MEIRTLGPDSKHLPAVQKLWRAHSATLGYLTEGAFADYAHQKTILAALTPEGELAGYLLYRRAYNKAVIVHLCINESWRGQKLGRLLVDALVKRTQNLRGIELTCRRDFEASKVWPKIGFIAARNKVGRSKARLELTCWWRPNPIDDLFSRAQPPEIAESPLVAALDANVFFDLIGGNPKNEESLSLTADWVSSEVDLCVTEEIFNEIERNPDSAERTKQRRRAHEFEVLRCDAQDVQRYVDELQPLFPIAKAQDDSDLRQVARAIASGADVFVTRDEEIVSRLSDEVHSRFNLSILRPSELIVRLDELLREKEYQPARLSGTHWTSSRMTNSDERQFVDDFYNNYEGKRDFLASFRKLQASPRTVDLRRIEVQGNVVAIVGYARYGTDELEIPILRLSGHRLRGTLARHLLVEAVRASAEEGRSTTRFTDRYLHPDLQSALPEAGFMRSGEHWIRLNLKMSAPLASLVEKTSSLVKNALPGDTELHQLIFKLTAPQQEEGAATVAALERVLWPAKIIDAKLPCFIVPIQRGWAEQLLDHESARWTLFGADPFRALNIEGAYYRASQPRVVSAPGRILWYVSDKNEEGAIRACSRLDDVLIDKPKPLFRRFERLGVYKWYNVKETAKGDLDNDLMVIRFSGTESLHKPVPWSELQRILEKHARKNPIASPVQISSAVFFEIYNAGIANG